MINLSAKRCLLSKAQSAENLYGRIWNSYLINSQSVFYCRTKKFRFLHILIMDLDKINKLLRKKLHMMHLTSHEIRYNSQNFMCQATNHTIADAVDKPIRVSSLTLNSVFQILKRVFTVSCATLMALRAELFWCFGGLTGGYGITDKIIHDVYKWSGYFSGCDTLQRLFAPNLYLFVSSWETSTSISSHFIFKFFWL